MNIRFASDDDIPAVARFNQRLREGGRGEEQITLRKPAWRGGTGPQASPCIAG